ncbi:MAG: fused response regulator/phosphatase [Alphaproteobacteria bacterium]|nr:fused response regulator/phosphatase [Alphaproteobacteria bacterium]MBF0130551.1 fused response regulator/phosphatase [Alphaproteobacteria bacterium]
MTGLRLSEGEISLADSRVLIVDDNRGSRALLGALVAQVGVGNIEYAMDGEEGLAKIASFLPDLVLLDVRMPKMDGFEMCRRLRQNRAQADLPVLIQTALNDDGSRADSFRAGATDMVSKPVVPIELMARVRIHLEKRLLIRNLSAYQERVAQELHSARAMQLGLLPKDTWVADVGARHGLVISSHFEASSEIGGDIWDMVEIDDGRLGLFICDFSGHGVTAALNTFRLHTLVRQTPPGDSDPGAWLTGINARLKGLLPPGQFATLLYAILDTVNDTFTYASAGSPSPILGIGGTADVVGSEGLFLGVTADAVYQTRTVPLPPGGFVFLYSDALTESLGVDGRSLNEDGLLDLVRGNLGKPSEAPLRDVLDTFFASVPRPLPDDLTAVWIARR